MVVVTEKSVQEREEQLQQEEHRMVALDYASRVFQGHANTDATDVIIMAKKFQEYLKG